MDKLSQTAIVLFASFALAGPAAAHARLKTARPAVGSTVATSPHAIELDFSEGVVPRFSGLALRDSAGKTVALGKPESGGGGAATLVVPLSATLAPGTYSVTWHAVSVDTHRTQGSFRFTIAP